MRKKNARVYIPQQPMRRTANGLASMHDFTPALEFGMLNVLLPNAGPPPSMEPVIAVLKRKLADFTDDDYILATGDPAVIGAATVVAAWFNNGRVKMLRWDRSMSMYMELQIDLLERSESNADRKKAVAA